MTVGERPSYFLSDLHLAAASGERTERLLRFFGARIGEAAAVYLVGDVFDFWLGYRSVVYHAYFPVLRRLAELVEGGTRVVVFSGNHDPDPGPLWASLGIEIHEGPLTLTLGGRRVWVEHGDTIDPRGPLHRGVCKLARHPLARRAARAVHPDVAWRLSRAYSRGKPHRYDAPLPAGLIERWFPERVAAGFDVAIIGHYHRAVHHVAELGGRPRQLFALGDWVEQHTYLRYDGAFTLLRDRGPDRPPVALPPGDHAPG